jgi:hypothetical protein
MSGGNKFNLMRIKFNFQDFDDLAMENGIQSFRHRTDAPIFMARPSQLV